MHKPAARVLKWAWILGVLALAVWLVCRSRADIIAMLRDTSLVLLLASTVLMIGAKLLLAENARIAAARCGIPLPFGTAARLYNLSQLGKYVPGSVWQFVGRAAAYRQRGSTYRSITDALLIESLWIVAGASIAGVLLTGPALGSLAAHGLAGMPGGWWAALSAAGLLGVLAVFFRWRDAARHYLRLAVPPVRILAVQAGIWILLGLAFWALLSACGLQVPVVFAAGLFALAYVLGFLVLFAPAGLGVRDAVLVFGLVPYATVGEAVAVTVLARVLYMLVDVLLALGPEPFFALADRKNRRVGS